MNVLCVPRDLKLELSNECIVLAAVLLRENQGWCVYCGGMMGGRKVVRQLIQAVVLQECQGWCCADCTRFRDISAGRRKMACFEMMVGVPGGSGTFRCFLKKIKRDSF